MDTTSCRTFSCMGHWAHTYASSQLNRVSRREVRYENGLVVHTLKRPAPRSTARAPHCSVSPLYLALIPVSGNKPNCRIECKLRGLSLYVSNTIIPGIKFQKKHRHSINPDPRGAANHARISTIDVSGALELLDIVAVITGTDAEALSTPFFGLLPGWSTRCLAVEKVCSVSETVAVVVAQDRYRFPK